MQRLGRSQVCTPISSKGGRDTRVARQNNQLNTTKMVCLVLVYISAVVVSTIYHSWHTEVPFFRPLRICFKFYFMLCLMRPRSFFLAYGLVDTALVFLLDCYRVGLLRATEIIRGDGGQNSVTRLPPPSRLPAEKTAVRSLTSGRPCSLPILAA